MDKGDKIIYLIFFIFTLFVLTGFYLTQDKINSLETKLLNFELQSKLPKSEENIISATSTSDSNEQDLVNKLINQTKETIIETAIIFDIQSSPILQPQTKITIAVENVSKLDDGTVKISIKAFTNEATTYSALEPRDFFELINIAGQNQRPISVNGEFNSVPPKNSVLGIINFKIPSEIEKIIIQIGPSGNIKYYEFNFSKKTYKEISLG